MKNNDYTSLPTLNPESVKLNGNGSNGNGIDKTIAAPVSVQTLALIPLIKKNKGLIISATLFVTTLCATYALFLHQSNYSASAGVIIKDSAVKARYVTDTYSTTSSQDTSPVLNTIELLKSDKVSEALYYNFITKHPQEMKRLKVESLEDWQKAYADGKGIVDTRNIPGTDVINLSFKWQDPELAREGMNVLLGAFQQASLDVNRSEQRERYLYLEEQASDIRGQLGAIRDHIRDFKQKYGVTNIDEDLKNYSKSKQDLEFTLNSVASDAASYSTVTSSYRSALGMPLKQALAATALGEDENLKNLYNDYYKLAEEYASLSSRYTPNHKRVKEMYAKLKQTEQNILKQSHRSLPGGAGSLPASATMDDSVPYSLNVPNGNVIADKTRGDAVKSMLDAQAMANGYGRKAQTINRYLSQVNQRIKTLPQIKTALENLTQQERGLSTALDAVEQQMMDAKIREAQTFSNIKIFRHLLTPKNSLPPSKSQLILFGLLAGLGASTAFVMLREQYGKTAIAFLKSGTSEQVPA
jgi:uncharacterized protein involved in exopolysaccharide biosynthesis